MAHQHPDHTAHLKRLNRIEGQVRGIAKMVEDRRYCIEILDQISAAKSALDRVALDLMHTHIDHCVSDAIRGSGGQEMTQELMVSLKRFVK
ncbi:MAG: metal-sensitive transcriptional regulator [Candidatus Omnitrophica bacterium]|nr:metal-sensitive transcriptional regulator [Candidatus Omnitrophota bacterium]